MNTQEYLYNIGSALSQLGNELQTQVRSQRPMNIHGHIKQTVDYLTFYLHNLNVDLDACRYDLIKDGESNLNLIEIESLKGEKIRNQMIVE